MQVWFSNRRARWRKQTANNVGGAENDDVTLRHPHINQSTLATQLQYHAVTDRHTGMQLLCSFRDNERRMGVI